MLQLENSESPFQRQDKGNASTSCDANVNINSGRAQTIEIAQGHSARFSSGTLTHPFNMRSIYKHVNTHGEKEATTHQDEWVTVDYIFYSNIQPVEKYTLPTTSQCSTLPMIPNFVIGSDHLCIGATFHLTKKKSTL